jgi:hypothetical protein
MMVKVKRPKNNAPLAQKYLEKYGFLKGYSSDWHAVDGDLYKAIKGNTAKPSHNTTVS